MHHHHHHNHHSEARGRRLPPPRCGNLTYRMAWYCLLALLVTLLLAGPPATSGATRANHSARHRHSKPAPRDAEFPINEIPFIFPGDDWHNWLRSEPRKLEATVSVSNDEIALRAWNPTCSTYWAFFNAEGFGCPRISMDGFKGSVESFMMAVSVYKEDRLTGQLNSLTNCTGWLLDPTLVLTYAECVGPRSEWEVPTRIRVHPMREPASSPTGSWAERTCWSSKTRWPGLQRASYELAVLRLAKPPAAETEEVCVGRSYTPGRPLPNTPDPPGPCAVVSVCDLNDQEPVNDEGHFPVVKVTPVRRMRDEKLCRERYAYGANWAPGPPQMACWESTSKPPVNLQENLCPVEYSRAVYCWARPGCPKSKHHIDPQANLVGLGPMFFQAGKKRSLYQPFEAPGTPAGVTSMADLIKLHEQIKDMLVDVKLHNHGGSGRSICRNLQPARGGGYRQGLRVSNTGYKPARLGEFDKGHREVRTLTAADLPKTPDALDCTRCWSAGSAEYLTKLASDCKKADNCRLKRTPGLPFLLELNVRKRITVWGPNVGGPEMRHEHNCEAWLVDRDTALTHAECVGPETNFDRIEGVTVRLPAVTANASDVEMEREAMTACWAREAAPYHWHRGLELAAVRFEPPVEYKENVLQPACLLPRETKERGPSDCAVVTPCSSGPKRQVPKGAVEWFNQTSSTAVVASQIGLNYLLQPHLPGWFAERYLSLHLANWESYYDRAEPLCAAGTAPPYQGEELRMTLCKSACRGAKDNLAAYLMGVRLGPIPPDHPKVRYNEPPNFEFWPSRESSSILQLDLSLAERQIFELLLALHVDNTGTQDVVCQRIWGPNKRRGGGGGGRRRHSKQSAARRRHRVG